MEKRGRETGIRKNILLRTNLLVCAVIVLGFAVTTLVGYRANQKFFRKDMESVTSLTSQGIYHEIDSIFSRPISISLTMAGDSLLKTFLESEQDHLEDPFFLETMRSYLNAYREQYDYDSIFLASVKTARYYNFNGLDRTLERSDPENVWFYDFLERPDAYTINIDNDQVAGAGNEVTVFINCRILGADGEAMGVVGVGFRVDSLQSLLRGYEERYGVSACLVDEAGMVRIDTDRTGYEGEVDYFSLCPFPELREQLLRAEEQAQTFWHASARGNGYVVSRYVPNLKWHLLVEHDTTALDRQLSDRLRKEVLVLAAVIAVVLVAITSVMRRYNARIIELTVAVEKEHRTVFQEAAEQLYEGIYEIDVTHNRPANEATALYFESMGAPAGVPYEKAMEVIAEKQVKEDYRKGYLGTFSHENVLREFEKGTENLRYDFPIVTESGACRWIRITAHLFFWAEDCSVRMLVYRENIDAQKQRELYWFEQMQKDPLTGLLNKAATQDRIRALLAQSPEDSFAFFILDIDNFKGANDLLGHAAGDAVLADVANALKAQFREEDIVGRIGGDEFVAFAAIPDEEAARQRARSLVSALRRPADAGAWTASVSVGVALAPRDGAQFESLYRKADAALYDTKRRGKNGFAFYRKAEE